MSTPQDPQEILAPSTALPSMKNLLPPACYMLFREAALHTLLRHLIRYDHHYQNSTACRADELSVPTQALFQILVSIPLAKPCTIQPELRNTISFVPKAIHYNPFRLQGQPYTIDLQSSHAVH